MLREGDVIDAVCDHLQQAGYTIKQKLRPNQRLDIGSVPYLAGHLKAESLPAYSLDTILKSVRKIEEMIAGRFRLKKKSKK